MSSAAGTSRTSFALFFSGPSYKRLKLRCAAVFNVSPPPASPGNCVVCGVITNIMTQVCSRLMTNALGLPYLSKGSDLDRRLTV